jgi:hypothetical protein
MKGDWSTAGQTYRVLLRISVAIRKKRFGVANLNQAKSDERWREFSTLIDRLFHREAGRLLLTLNRQEAESP